MAEKTPRPWTPSEERFGTLAVRIMSAVNTWIFQASGGRLGNRFLRGAPVCLLTTTGARSGTRRTTPLIYLADGPNVVFVASKGGMSHSPAWYHNLAKHPECEVRIGADLRRMTARRASAAEKADLWPKLVAIYRDYDDYQARTTRDIPVLILTPRERERDEAAMEFSLAQVFDAVAEACPTRQALAFRDRKLSYGELRERARRLANHLLSRGLRVRQERARLAPHESGQDHLALYLYNGNEYCEGMLGAFMSRVAPLNVNYRYVDEELVYLLQNSGARAIVYHAEFAPCLARIRKELPQLEVLLQVADESGNALLPGAVDYEQALAGASPERPDVAWSPDDLYILYTGGTTGMPKGVLWRSADIYVAAMGGRRFDGSEHASLDSIVEQAKQGGALKILVGPPLMHGAAQWVLFMMLTCGHGVLFPRVVRTLDPDDFLRTAERERASGFSIVGDAFAVPILDQLDKSSYDLSSLISIGSGGAPLSVAHKQKFLEHFPKAMVIDAIGSSETGAQASNAGTKAGGVSTGDFRPVAGCTVVSAELDRVLAPPDDAMGWFAQCGRVPLGYLGDAAKTARTFPAIDGKRYSIPGDRARYRADGSIEVLGRDSVTINSGGEKIFAEEVENALKLHPAVYDAVVCGRASSRWGQEVVAIVRLRDGANVAESDLLEECARHLARYKLPKQFLFREEIVRSPSGKADYRWAKNQVEGN